MNQVSRDCIYFNQTRPAPSWLAYLYQHACDQRRWRQAAQHKMEILSPDMKPGLARSVGRTRGKLVIMYIETKI